MAEAREARLRAQIEFYFSDSNLPIDKFLLDAVQGDDAAEDGSVSLKTLCSFKKMREMLGGGKGGAAAAVGDDKVAEVAAALKDSAEVALVGDAADASAVKVRRVAPFDVAAAKAAVEARSCYAAPLPRGTTIDALRDFFDAEGLMTRSARLRRHARSKDFRGSAFIEFESEDGAKAACAKDALKFDGAPLKLQMQADFKAAVIAARKARAEAGKEDPDPAYDDLDEDAHPINVGAEQGAAKGKRKREDGGDAGGKRSKGADGKAKVRVRPCARSRRARAPTHARARVRHVMKQSFLVPIGNRVRSRTAHMRTNMIHP